MRGSALIRISPPIRAFAWITVVTLASFAALWLASFGTTGPMPWELWSAVSDVSILAGLTDATVGVLGISVTVVAIVVELAANRYTPRVSELFVRDPLNVGVLSWFVVSSVITAWIGLSLNGDVVPPLIIYATIALTTVSLLMILPYFAYVVHFLSPQEVVRRIRDGGRRELDRLGRRGPRAIPGARDELLQAAEQLGDIALNSVEKKDKPLAFDALTALSELAEAAVRAKPVLPPAFFDTAPLVASDQDFIALHPDMVHALTARRTWVEMKVLRQYQSVFGEAVNKLRDVNHLAAILTRRLAAAALEIGDLESVAISVRFLNTFMRAALNARDVRTAYNLLNEYRELAEHGLRSGHGDLALELASRMRFYGQLAFAQQLPFVLESAAYDLGQAIEVAHGLRSPEHDALLGIFLELDREPEARGMEASLRGVRKAQVKLATWYLSRGEEALALRIANDMRAEPASRLASIRAELEAVVEAEFWEVSDRGTNFEWLSPERRPHLVTFFGWLNS